MLFTLRTILQAGLLMLTFAIVFSCESSAYEGEETGSAAMLDSIPATKEAQRQFYHAWLADCVNEEYRSGKEDALSELSKLAISRVKGAIADSAIIGYFGQETLVWGPVIAVSYIDESLNRYTPDNLLYCLHRKDSNNRDHYMVGIAGTNGISSYDWLQEDLKVGTQQPWSNGGKISYGSYLGMQNLTGFKDDGVTIDSFLRKQALDNPDMSVEVAGHSLGGAQTQTMASFLKGRLKSINPKIPVSGWAYAGPTAGNGEFADSLIAQIDGYYAFHNTLDVVPHAWGASELNELCSLYDGFTFCKKHHGNQYMDERGHSIPDGTFV